MTASPDSELVVKEGIAGYWSYHLAERDKYKSLCGKPVMNTGMPRDRWGESCANESIRYKWCEACKEMADELAV